MMSLTSKIMGLINNIAKESGCDEGHKIFEQLKANEDKIDSMVFDALSNEYDRGYWNRDIDDRTEMEREVNGL